MPGLEGGEDHVADTVHLPPERGLLRRGERSETGHRGRDAALAREEGVPDGLEGDGIGCGGDGRQRVGFDGAYGVGFLTHRRLPRSAEHNGGARQAGSTPGSRKGAPAAGAGPRETGRGVSAASSQVHSPAWTIHRMPGPGPSP